MADENETQQDENRPEEETSQMPELEPPRAGATKNLLLLYSSMALNSWGDRMWQFAMPITFATVYPNTLFPVALFSSFSYIVSALCGSPIGYFVDKKPRLLTLSLSLFVQNIAVAICAALMGLLVLFDKEPQSTSALSFYFPFSAWYDVLLFIASMVVGGVSALGTLASQVCIMKDWAIVISKAYNKKLSQVNATLRRIDLICNIISPVVYGLISTYAGPLVAIFVVCGWNVISFVPEYVCLLLIYRSTPALSLPKEVAAKTDDAAANTDEEKPKKDNICTVLFKGWKAYAQQPVLFASIAYVLLYITVLHTGGIMTNYLKSDQAQMHDLGIAIFRAFTAITGIMGTFIAPFLIRKMGIIKTGMAGVWFQITWLFVGIVFFVLFSVLTEAAFVLRQAFLYLFVFCIIVSRVGLWVFDLAETEIMQVGVLDEERGMVNSAESSMTNIADLSILILTMVVARPDMFYILVAVSALCITSAGLIYSVWTCLPGRKIVEEREAQENQEDHQELQDESVPTADSPKPDDEEL